MEERTVFICCCQGKYAICKRGSRGLLAGLWQFPDVEGALQPQQAMEAAQKLGLRPRQILRQLERKHIFTHVRWDMTGYYLEVSDMPEAFVWLTEAEIEAQTALPTAYRQFWEAREL